MSERIAIVAPRCAQGAYGGAELLALRIAQELSERYETEILTTCAVDYWTWENALPPGIAVIEGIPVRRFSVDTPRNLRDFNRLSRSFRFRIASLSRSEQEAWIKAQGPYSTPLLQYLFERRGNYDLFIFMPDLYATTYFGLPIVRERSLLVPLAHDEWPLYFPVWRELFGYPRVLFFVTPEERELIGRRFPGDAFASGMLFPRFRAGDASGEQSFVRAEPFMLYIGRIDEAKGVSELSATFRDHLARCPRSPWRLLLAGSRDDCAPSVPSHERIEWLQQVDEPMKWALLRDCDLLVVPGLYESLSIALIEGWLEARCALVNGRNPVLLGQVRRANGGLWYDSQAEFDGALAILNEGARATLGEQGRAFVRREYAKGNAVDAVGRVLRHFRRQVS